MKTLAPPQAVPADLELPGPRSPRRHALLDKPTLEGGGNAGADSSSKRLPNSLDKPVLGISPVNALASELSPARVPASLDKPVLGMSPVNALAADARKMAGPLDKPVLGSVKALAGEATLDKPVLGGLGKVSGLGKLDKPVLGASPARKIPDKIERPSSAGKKAEKNSELGQGAKSKSVSLGKDQDNKVAGKKAGLKLGGKYEYVGKQNFVSFNIVFLN